MFTPPDDETQIINIIIPEGSRNYLGVEVGKPNLKLCINKNNQCYKARVIAMAKKFPGFQNFASFYPINFLGPEGIVCKD